MRAVLDLNVFVSAVLSPRGAPAAIISAWFDGAFELVVSDSLLSELEIVLGYPKIRSRVSRAEAAELVATLRTQAIVAADAASSRHRSTDPDDDYLLALAEAEHAILVSGDSHVIELGDVLPIETPRAFLNRIQS